MALNAYYGLPESDVASRSLRLAVTTYRQGETIPAHEHGNAYICINTKGGFVERSGNTEHAVYAHDLVYHRRGIGTPTGFLTPAENA